MDVFDWYLVFCIAALALALPFLVDPNRPRDLQRQQRRANLLANYDLTPEEVDELLRR